MRAVAPRCLLRRLRSALRGVADSAWCLLLTGLCAVMLASCQTLTPEATDLPSPAASQPPPPAAPASPRPPGPAPEARTTPASGAVIPSKLGVFLPLSGPGARAGTQALHAIELALAVAQERTPGLNITLAVRDSSRPGSSAPAALRALIAEERVIGVIGPLLSRTATELAPVASELSVPLISPFARDSEFPALSPYALRNSLTDALQGRFLATYATEVLKLRRFVIVHPEDPYGTALRDRFREHVQQRQGEIVAVVSYPAKNANLRQRLTPLKDKTYDAIFLPDYADNVGPLLAQFPAALRQGAQLLGTDGWNAPSLVARGGRLVEGAIFVDGFFANAPTPTVKTFVERFRQKYKHTPDLLAAQAYDTFLLCAQVLQSGAQTPTQLRDGLVQVRNFDGVSGLTSMRETRDAEKVPYVLTVRRGQIVPLEGAMPRVSSVR